jgi:hypothetical protein
MTRRLRNASITVFRGDYVGRLDLCHSAAELSCHCHDATRPRLETKLEHVQGSGPVPVEPTRWTEWYV